MVAPDSRQQQIHVQQIFHGNSSKAFFSASSLMGRSKTPTENPRRFSILTCAGPSTRSGSNRVSKNFPFPATEGQIGLRAWWRAEAHAYSHRRRRSYLKSPFRRPAFQEIPLKPVNETTLTTLPRTSLARIQPF